MANAVDKGSPLRLITRSLAIYTLLLRCLSSSMSVQYVWSSAARGATNIQSGIVLRGSCRSVTSSRAVACSLRSTPTSNGLLQLGRNRKMAEFRGCGFEVWNHRRSHRGAPRAELGRCKSGHDVMNRSRLDQGWSFISGSSAAASAYHVGNPANEIAVGTREFEPLHPSSGRCDFDAGASLTKKSGSEKIRSLLANSGSYVGLG